MRRVVITGLGAVTPIGLDARSAWDAAVSGRSGVGWIEAFDASEYPVRIAAEVRGFEIGELVPAKEARRMDRNVLLAVAAAQEAWDDAGLNGVDATRVGILVGSAIGGIATISEQQQAFVERGFDRVSPFFIPSVLVDTASGQIAIQLGIKGQNFAPVSACATGSTAIGEGAASIRRGQADVVLAGGTEAAITPLILAGFCAMRGLVAEEEDPTLASRPFDATRAGFVMGEGSCILVLEEFESATARGAKIYAEVLGYGVSSDASHVSDPDPSGQNPARAMKMAFADAGIDPEVVGYVNAHGTSTPSGDSAETRVLKLALGEDKAYRTPVSSTKGATGHCLGAAGAVEAIFCTFALQHGVLPPTINYETPDPECDLDYIPNEARRQEIEVAVNNSFGFGGHNACVVFRRWDEAA
jgi:3-oxoacyl-[acyl-carrier-protein] synthase II